MKTYSSLWLASHKDSAQGKIYGMWTLQFSSGVRVIWRQERPNNHMKHVSYRFGWGVGRMVAWFIWYFFYSVGLGYFWKPTANTFVEKHFFPLLVFNANIHLINLIQGGIRLGLQLYMKQSSFLHYYFLIIILFSIQTTVKPLLPHPVFQDYTTQLPLELVPFKAG